MRDVIEIGPVPYGEDCEQLGPNYDSRKARKECEVFLRQLRRAVGKEPEGAALRIKSSPHDFGTYLEVVCSFEEDNEAAIEYAFKCEGEGPEFWDEQARLELLSIGLNLAGLE